MAKAQPRNRLGDILCKAYRHQRKLEVEWEKAVDRRGAQLAMAYAGELPARQRRRIRKLASGEIRRGAFVPTYDDAWQFLFARRGDKPSFLNQAERDLFDQQGAKALTPTLWNHVVEKLATAMYRTAGRAFDQELREFCRAGELSDKLAKAFELLEEQGYADDLLDGTWSVLSGDATTAGLSKPKPVRQEAAWGTVVNHTVNVHIAPAGGLAEGMEKKDLEDTPITLPSPNTISNREAAKTADEAIRLIGSDWATYKQLSDVTDIEQSRLRGAVRRARKSPGWIGTLNEKPLTERSSHTSKISFRICALWRFLPKSSARAQK